MKKLTQMAGEARKAEHVMVTFGRGSAELKRNFDQIARDGNYTRAGLALALIREGVERRMPGNANKQQP